MFIKLIDTEKRQRRLNWWQFRALTTEGTITTVYIDIDGRSDVFKVEKPGEEIEAEIEQHKAMMDTAA